MGNQASEMHDKYRNQPQIPPDVKEFVPNPRGFNLDGHLTHGPSQVSANIPWTKHEYSAGLSFNYYCTFWYLQVLPIANEFVLIVDFFFRKFILLQQMRRWVVVNTDLIWKLYMTLMIHTSQPITKYTDDLDPKICKATPRRMCQHTGNVRSIRRHGDMVWSTSE